ncbi:MAG: class I poly(R)-hydroxyalkanoic acid synthase [Burkholderiales bacterium]|nr:class I poly(R)-hydroxyalkanoic acid synthase [Burkholderiales bacterium]
MSESQDHMAEWQALGARWMNLMQSQLAAKSSGAPQVQIPDPKSVQNAFDTFWKSAVANPKPLFDAQLAFWHDYAGFAQQAIKQLWLGEPMLAVADKRFKDDLWSQSPIFGLIKQFYLLAAEHIQEGVSRVGGLDEPTARKVAFYTRQFVDAMSPSNFLATNPAALKATLDSGGENLVTGFRHMIEDMERNNGRIMPRMTDLEAFELGRDIATTPGKVVFENDLIQLIQYTPTTPKVHAVPLLIVPPWINKYYILDLKQKNSLIRWLVDQGQTVFVISWVNPDARLRDKGFEHYMREGILAALDAMTAATGEKRANVAAYCIGGTLLAATLAWMAAARDPAYPPSRIRSASFFTTMIDFSEPGELGVFIDEDQLSSLDAYMDANGYLEGHQMATVFNMLRENDLIWNFVVQNYLMGKSPMAFDLLYWNCDSTRMPAAMHRFYLRKMYLENKLCKPAGVALDGVDIDIRKIKTPAYFISAREDHIAPWRSTYAGAKLFSGPVRFVLGGSGHIAGIVNPPAANKYGYVVADELADTPDGWLEGTTAHEGSWWTDWMAWLAPQAGAQVAARVPGEGGLKAIEDAPGRYVKARLK